ncbi:cytidine deaminase [Halarsenatibacter silvermanii]|uniref:Cytidine deaminase n=1 Tax=Halarsenatibacter silvermanii TaxID=321763 RepID=A0A1G9JU57_9FIRM|nr:cytidine deaminase [Halarsenatibacter silvermanii]SDL41180.1 cytidine deaminase [Halarsenatibacter silvermanii]
MALEAGHLDEIIDEARKARENAYVPYSNFRVGAAVLTAGGELFTGCNVENAALGLTNCAERTAIFSAVASGHQDFAALAVIADTDRPVSPCGSCRQVLVEFNPEMEVIMASDGGEYRKTKASELLPYNFTAEDMK